MERALRQFLIVLAAAGVTYGIGKLAGTAIGQTRRIVTSRGPGPPAHQARQTPTRSVFFGRR